MIDEASARYYSVFEVMLRKKFLTTFRADYFAQASPPILCRRGRASNLPFLHHGFGCACIYCVKRDESFFT